MGSLLHSLSPKYDELAQLFSPHSSLATIAKVDATANDVPEEISGFPTIKLYPAGKKGSPIDYNGARTVEDLATFVKESGTNKVDVSSDEAAEDDADKATKSKDAKSETMQHQAPAATEKGTAEKIKDGAQKVMDAASGGEDNMDDHDEL